jgi:hypothetical protein
LLTRHQTLRFADIDFFVLNYGAAGQLFSNNRDGTFSDVAMQVKLLPPQACFGVAVGDLDKNGFPDFFFPAMDGDSAASLTK